MAFATPYIENGILTYSVGTEWHALPVESRAWQEWLSRRRESFRFEDQLLSYTARLEQRENKHYWYAYYNYHKKLYKVYLGKTEELTFARLHAAAIELYTRCTSKIERKKHTSEEALSEPYKNVTAPQTHIETQLKGEHTSMNMETVYPFPSRTNDNTIFLSAPLIEPLTKREREILSCLIEGFSNKEIAQQLVLSTGTIKWHLKNLYNKLNIHTRSQAIARARALQL